MNGVASCSRDCLVEVGRGINRSEGRLLGETLDGLAWELLEVVHFSESIIMFTSRLDCQYDLFRRHNDGL